MTKIRFQNAIKTQKERVLIKQEASDANDSIISLLKCLRDGEPDGENAIFPSVPFSDDSISRHKLHSFEFHYLAFVGIARSPLCHHSVCSETSLCPSRMCIGTCSRLEVLRIFQTESKLEKSFFKLILCFCIR